MDTQQEIQEMQDQYGHLMALLPALENSVELWREATQRMQTLCDFYFNPKWLEYYDAADHFQIDTKGNYSVLSQDAIWNLLAEYQTLTEQIKPLLERLD
ncbi:DUF4298 domain-containing protein [Conservatibacter flavescens]|uniref:DUF4298 domain-containing protein n=1 Tax=Conservatibacter flavescens TaxID=28161 RepID=A0A2M8S3K6_9PAST|nr:DUF4298 domain-containing protein [Conservatibacter flavescens]PJG85734.1 DUF4298 domain-containing protein [Conservatibacter flavescens]